MSKLNSGHNSGSKNLNVPKQYMSAKENGGMEQRLLMLESRTYNQTNQKDNLNRVCLQQDALMPLLQMIEYIPSIQRTDAVSKQVQRKLEENENRLLQTEKLVDKKLKETTYNSINSSMMTPGDPKDIKKLEKNVNSLDLKFVQLNEKMEDLADIFEQKLKDQSKNLSEDIVKHECDKIRKEFQSEFRNIYKEINGLRNDMEFLMNEDKKSRMTKKIHNLGGQMKTEEKVFIINFMEQEQFIEDLEYYEKENSFRLNYELEFLNMVMDEINQFVQQYQKMQNKEQELPGLLEKVITIKYQIAATKKKFMMELRKIDQKFEILEQLGNEQQMRVLKSLFLGITTQDKKEDCANNKQGSYKIRYKKQWIRFIKTLTIQHKK